MKRFFIAFFIFLFLSLNIVIAHSLTQPQTLSKGIYTLKDINLYPNTAYTVQNISPNEYIYLLISDSNEIVHQSIELEPLSKKYNLEPLRDDYILSIVGKGKVIIS
ncbi:MULTISPECIES: hypothetical protein [unclassified Clostridium]|uniref:hypothetical protein n=1 Tax=unclassified Clostridium TaxID=2614128 RepID=UPI00029749DF|nr:MULTISPECIES: hypothetical protein [unclassified Clostridium]EKQ52806.1 MAG: hypothetical protein A370_04025 [Clostridium sp. Maddingley MBC34-26]